MRQNIHRLFSELPKPEDLGTDGFSGAIIEGFDNLRIARNTEGGPAFLVRVESIGGSNISPSIDLENIRILVNIDCKVTYPAGHQENGRFVIVNCISQDSLIHEYFIGVVSSVITQIGRKPSADDVLKAIKYVKELFAALLEPPKKSVQGLWAELLLLSIVAKPREMIAGWHCDPSDRYDFASGADRLEVKSSGTSMRRHYFSFEQLNPPGESRVVIASVSVQKSGGGKSVGDLVATISERLGGDLGLISDLNVTVAKTLGRAVRNANDSRFDEQLAKESLRYYNAEDIPCIGRTIPAEISEIKFAADISGVGSVSKRRLVEMGGMFGNIY